MDLATLAMAFLLTPPLPVGEKAIIGVAVDGLLPQPIEEKANHGVGQT